MAEFYKQVSNPITGTVFYQTLVLSSGMEKIMIQMVKNFHNHIEIVCLTHPNICSDRCHEKFGKNTVACMWPCPSSHGNTSGTICCGSGGISKTRMSC